MTTHSDNTSQEKPHSGKPVTVPGIKTAVARRTRYDPPRRFVTMGREHRESDGIEIDVEMDADFPIAGVGPALFVGKVAIVDSERLGERRYRFFVPGSTALQDDAALALGRAGSGVPAPEQRSRAKLSWAGRATR
jgi:hypothetical protein